ncbi:VOC family protein [Microvirga antarctica]|uniref:VOC family protein n=1 Tax=Microvirga antarctica TaxID=2819233 RepID=UPI001B300566|nr:VOC family protein [Microvirga antarctica]
MSESEGTFVWYELMTSDLDSAQGFYRDVVGWQTEDFGRTDFRYTILRAGDARIGGAMALPAEACEAGAKPGWIGYIGTSDVDATAARVVNAGGAILRPAEDIPDVGRFAVVADPQGAAFVLFRGTGSVSEKPSPWAPGHVGWHELHAAEWNSAFAFYEEMFGWQKAEAMDMGQMGKYQLFSAGADPIGGMMTKMEAIPKPFWLYYFNTPDIDAAMKRVVAGGGQVLNGPHEVPGGAWIIQCADPQGAMFAMVGGRT